MKVSMEQARESEVLDEIRRIFSREIGRSEPVLGSHELAKDLQLDSVNLLTLVVGLENRFQVILTDEDAQAVATVDDLVRLVSSRQTESRGRR